MNDICAGIVLYEPDIERLQANIEAILPQVGRVYLVDNGSSNIESVRFAFEKHGAVQLTENATNRGIAAALNQLCRAAEEDGYDWIVTLDQDSVAYGDMIEAFRPYLDEPDVAILCPLIVDDNESGLVRSNPLPPVKELTRCITSGALTNLFIWRKIGGFDERMFIDCVDFDYCTNAVLHGYHVRMISAARLHHRMGRATEVRFFVTLGRLLHIPAIKKQVFTYNHSPMRTYYYARNIYYYRRKYGKRIDQKTERRVYWKWVVLKLLFEPQKWQKLRAICKGRRDGAVLFRQYRKEMAGQPVAK